MQHTWQEWGQLMMWYLLPIAYFVYACALDDREREDDEFQETEKDSEVWS